MVFRRRKKEVPQLRKVPVNLGIIMDGNGRWAKKRGLPRQAQHEEARRVPAGLYIRGLSVATLCFRL